MDLENYRIKVRSFDGLGAREPKELIAEVERLAGIAEKYRLEMVRCGKGWEDVAAELRSRTVSNNDLQEKVSRQAGVLADLRSQLSTAQRERDELRSDIVRYKMHLECAERAAKANAREATKAESELLQVKGERDRYREALEAVSNAKFMRCNRDYCVRVARAALHPATEPCTPCGGSGLRKVYEGPEDYHEETCPDCAGEGINPK